jgi:hypothetical protein
MSSSSPSLADHKDVAAAVAPQPSPSFLSIFPFHHLSHGVDPVGAATNPGLVSPTDSQPALLKNVLLSVTSHAIPTLQQHNSIAATVPTSFSNQGRFNESALIASRPPGKFWRGAGMASAELVFSLTYIFCFGVFFSFSSTGPFILPKIPNCSAEVSPITVELGGPVRLNKFVRRLHDMLVVEKDSGIVEWRRGLLVLFSTDAFTQKILPKYFNTRNFKTFRRQVRRKREIEYGLWMS